MALDELRKLFEEATGRVGDAVDEYNATPSPSAGALRPFFGLSSVETKTSSPEMDAFLAKMDAVRDRRDAEAASRLSPVKAREDTPREGVPSALRPSNWVTARPASLGPSQPSLAPQLGPFYKEIDESALPPVGIRLPVEAGPTLTAPSVPVVSRDTAPAVKAPETTPIPVASAPTEAGVPAVAASALTPTGPENPAPPAGTSSTVKPPPVDAGSGGDDALGRLSLGQALTRALEGSGSIISGQNLRSGAADTLGDRMKQIEALRAKREEQGITDTRERANNRAQVDYLISRFPDRAEDLQKLYGMTGKPNFSQMLRVEEQVALDKAKKATEEVKPDIARRGIEVKEEDAESKAKKREQDIALGWARFNAQSAAAAAAAARDIASSGASRAEQKDIDGQLENIQKIVKGGSYTPLIASLEQADKAIATLGAPPSAAAQMKHALPGGDRFLSPQEKAYYTSTDKLRQMDQLAVSGKVVSEPERAEFLRQYGASWYASPKAAAAYIDMLRAKTANQLNSDLASVRASPSGQKAIAAYERQPGAVTPMHPVLKGAMAPALAAGGASSRQQKPQASEGYTPLWNKSQGKWQEIPNEKAEAAKASGRFEE